MVSCFVNSIHTSPSFLIIDMYVSAHFALDDYLNYFIIEILILPLRAIIFAKSFTFINLALFAIYNDKSTMLTVLDIAFEPK